MAGSAARPPTDEELVDRAVSGDVEAFERLVERYQQAVFQIALYKSGNVFDAEDLAQEVFLAAYRALRTLRDRSSFSGWLFGIAYNRCHKWYHRERSKVIRFHELRQVLERDARLARRAEGPSADEPFPLAEFLRRLPEDERRVLVLKYLEGRSYREIEQRMGIPTHRIDYLIRKAKKTIRERWERARTADARP